MKILFAGTPEFALAPLQSLIENGFDVMGVLTQTDKPQGRKGILTPPPVKTLAEKLGLPVIQPEKAKFAVEDIKAFGAELMVTCAYGQILTQDILDIFPKGVWNIHAGLLPKYRGASPIQSSILAGETQTGVSVMKTELGLDCGDILAVKTTEITPTETYGELSDRLSVLGAELIVDALNSLKSGEYVLTPQGKDDVNVVRKIGKEHAQIDFNKSAKEIVDLIRGMNPAPIAYTAADGVKINVYLAEKAEVPQGSECAQNGEVLTDTFKQGFVVKCGDGAVKLLEVQAAGGKRMKGGDFVNGRKVQKGQVLSC